MSHVVPAIALRDLPTAREFVLSPGFAGLAALVAAVVVLCAALYGSRRAGKRSWADREQRERHHVELRDDTRRAAAVARCWDRWWQVLEKAAMEPAASEGATLGLGPEVTLVVLRGLLRDAEELGDDTLVKAVAAYHEQLVLVLAQQGGPLSTLAATPSANGGATKTPRPAVQDGNAASPPAPAARPSAASSAASPVKAASAESPSPMPEEAGGRRRRR